MTARLRSALLAVAVGVIGAGCSVARVEETDLGHIPDGELEVIGGGMEATGPIVAVGSGRMAGVGWRYAIFESADGLCSQLETVTFASSSCGELVPPPDSLFGSVGTGELGSAGDGVVAVEGFVNESVTAVWVESEDGRRAAAALLPLDEVGLRANAFVALLPEGFVPARAVAGGSGVEALETYDLP